MAIIKCTISEYHRYIGPSIRNKVNAITRSIKHAKQGICEFCGEKKVLESAHIHGRGRKKIIEMVLKEYVIEDGIIEGDLSEIEMKIVEEHSPIENTFKFLCNSCHREYDRKQPRINIKKNITGKTMNFSDLDFKKINRIKLWAKRKHQDNHKIVDAYLKLSKNGKVTYESLEKACISDPVNINLNKFKGHFPSMKTDEGNSHGKVFYEKNGYVFIYPIVLKEINAFFNSANAN